MEQSLIDNVLQLSPPERMQLLDIIYSSLRKPNEIIDNVWYDEAERRLAAFESGKTKGISAKTVEELSEAVEDFGLNEAIDEAEATTLLDREAALKFLEDQK
jgi:putative addiction module component (TIGR02574 family)